MRAPGYHRVGLAITCVGLSTASSYADFTCTIAGWSWKGEFSDDFLLNANWYNCGLINGPTTGIPIYIGPVEQLFQGISLGISFPANPARLASDFSSPGLTMANGVDTHFTIADAVYTCPLGTIGAPSPHAALPTSGTAYLTLDNAVWDGWLQIGSGDGVGVLTLLNGSFVTGGISIGGASGSIINGSTYLLTTSQTNSFSGASSWRNAAGSTLDLADGGSLTRAWSSPALITLEAGSTLRKTTPAGSNVSWDLVNDGAIEVDDGPLYVQGAYASDGGLIQINGGMMSIYGPVSGATVAAIAQGSRLEIFGNPAPHFELDAVGDIGLSPSAGGGTLDLHGDYRVVQSGSVNAVVNNHGAAVLTSNLSNSFSGPASWNNKAGSALELAEGGNFTFGGSSPTEVVIEPGSTLRTTGPTSNSVGWHLVNNGVIQVEAGPLYLTGGYSSDAGLIDVQAGTAHITGTLSGSSVANIAEGSRLDLHAAAAPHFVLDAVGDIGLSLTGGTLDLHGQYRVVQSATADGVINSHGAASLRSGLSNSHTGSATWNVTAGSTLELSDAGNFSLGWSSPAEVVIEPGSTMSKTSPSASNVGWHLVNDGLIQVEDGLLYATGGYTSDAGLIDVRGGTMSMSGPLTGSSEAIIAEGSRLDIHGNPAPEFTIDLTGDIGLSPGSGGGRLDLRGDYRVVQPGTVDALLVNHGVARLDTGLTNSPTGSAAWRNETGSTLELALGGSFNTSWSSPAQVVIEPGSTLRKAAPSASSVSWDLTNNGLIEIQEGSLYAYGDFVCNGTVDVRSGVLHIASPDPEFCSEHSLLTGNGTIELSSAQAMLNQGTIRPGFADGASDSDGLVIDVPFIQNSDDAVLAVRVGALASRLTCTGVYEVGGTIHVERVGDEEPDPGAEFVVLQADFASGIFGNFFNNAVPVVGLIAREVRTGDLKFDVEYTANAVIVRNVTVVLPPCAPADIADPSGVLNLDDISTFVSAFILGDLLADLDGNGSINLDDIEAFVASFLAGCP